MLLLLLLLLLMLANVELIGTRVLVGIGEARLALGRVAELVQVDLERLDVVVEAERRHGVQYVLAVDGLALLLRAALGRLARYEADELGDALLHALFGVLGYLAALGYGLLHQLGHIRYGQEAVLFAQQVRQLLVVAEQAAARARHAQHSAAVECQLMLTVAAIQLVACLASSSATTTTATLAIQQIRSQHFLRVVVFTSAAAATATNVAIVGVHR